MTSFEALKNAPLALIAKDGQFSWWQWLKVTHGFQDEALKPYNYNLGPFLANNKAIQQGYSVAEPIYVENQGKFKPVVHLLADHGFSTYSTVIEARTDTVQEQARPGAALRGRVGHRLGELPLRQPQGGQRADDQGQPRDDRGRDGGQRGADEGPGHRRFGRGRQPGASAR